MKGGAPTVYPLFDRLYSTTSVPLDAAADLRLILFAGALIIFFSSFVLRIRLFFFACAFLCLIFKELRRSRFPMKWFLSVRQELDSEFQSFDSNSHSRQYRNTVCLLNLKAIPTIQHFKIKKGLALSHGILVRLKL
ncbi:hypothetical protein BCY86_00325 [Pajaroellobacter abortibovis]|uniref:Uncharacterized protein n=1 Tax=Pajaroellobacter abortibovis TaxID=1882918 RepID=A0A1L6MUU1_9BACT|nr:hypothetical protein BCY86_00325 [Pajaroellobacter abortibovis]